MGLLDFEYDEEGANEESSWFDFFDLDDEGTSYYTSGQQEEADTTDTEFWDWGDEEDSEEGFDFSSFGELGELEVDEEGKPTGEKPGGISSGVWSKLLDFGLGSLGQWMKNKDKKKPAAAKRSGGGGGPPPAVTAIKKAIPVGTRTAG